MSVCRQSERGHGIFGKRFMLNNKTLSRREFVFAAGGAVALATGAGKTFTSINTEPAVGIITRCGKLRFGYSCAGNVALGQIETKHAQQVSYALSLWNPETAPRYYSTGAVSVPHGQPVFTAMMTSLSGAEGMRFEVVTSETPVSGPEFILRGETGTLSVSESTLWFTGGSGTSCQKEKVCAFPDCYAGGAWSSEIQSIVSPEYTRVAGKMIDDARNRLLAGHDNLC